jgi:hypothetical protein
VRQHAKHEDRPRCGTVQEVAQSDAAVVVFGGTAGLERRCIASPVRMLSRVRLPCAAATSSDEDHGPTYLPRPRLLFPSGPRLAAHRSPHRNTLRRHGSLDQKVVTQMGSVGCQAHEARQEGWHRTRRVRADPRTGVRTRSSLHKRTTERMPNSRHASAAMNRRRSLRSASIECDRRTAPHSGGAALSAPS